MLTDKETINEFEEYIKVFDASNQNEPKSKKTFKAIYGTDKLENIPKDIRDRIESTICWKYDWLCWITDDKKLYSTNRARQHLFNKRFEPWIAWNTEIYKA